MFLSVFNHGPPAVQGSLIRGLWIGSQSGILSDGCTGLTPGELFERRWEQTGSAEEPSGFSAVSLGVAGTRKMDLAGNRDTTPADPGKPSRLAGKSYVRNPSGLCALDTLQKADRRSPALGVAAGASLDPWIYSWWRN